MINQLYLYVALIGVGIVLFALTRPKKSDVLEANSRQQQTTALDFGLKETLDEFMNELERDNARMVDSFVKLQTDYKQKLASQQQVIQDLQLRMSQLEARLKEQHVTAPVVTSVDQVPQESVEPLGFMFNEKYTKVVELYRQGLTAEQIARSTDMGMGEIQLVIGLAKREDN